MAIVDHQTTFHKARIQVISVRVWWGDARPIRRAFSLDRAQGSFCDKHALGKLAPKDGGVTEFKVSGHGLGLTPGVNGAGSRCDVDRRWMESVQASVSSISILSLNS